MAKKSQASIDRAQKKAVEKAVAATKGKSASEQIAAITKAINSTGGITPSGGGGGGGTTTKTTTPPVVPTADTSYGVFKDLGSVQSFVNDVKDLDVKDVSGISSAIKKSGGSLSNLPANTSPTDVSSIQQYFSSPTMPETTADYMTDSNFQFGNTVNATTANAGLKSYLDELDRQMAEIEARRTAQANSPDAKNANSFLDKLMNRPSNEEVREKAQEDIGFSVPQYFQEMKQIQTEIGSLETSYANLVAAKDTQIAQSTDKMASMNFINNQIAQINRNAAPELNRIAAIINAKTGVAEMMRGQFADAQMLINQAVEDATAESRYNYEMYNMFYTKNKDALDRLDSQYKDAYDTARMIAMQSWENDRADRKANADMILELASMGIDASAGIGMDPQTFAQIYAPYLSAETKRQMALKLASGSEKRPIDAYTGPELKQLRAAGIDPLDTQTADEYLYGSKTRPPKNQQELDLLLSSIIQDGKKDSISGVYGELKLTPQQQEQYQEMVKSQSSFLYKASNAPVLKQAVDMWSYLFD